MIEFFGTFSICFCVSLCNISAYKDNEPSPLMPGLVYGILILIFSQVSRGYSKGFFNPYFSIFEILSGRLSVERGISNDFLYIK
jgi:glycerol uptake facilitator-like aquaporin